MPIHTKSAPRHRRSIGVLCLEVPPDRFEGSLSNPALFPVPVLYEKVDGAWVDAILDSRDTLLQPTIDAARRLEQRGATFLISNCGFFIRYYDAVKQNISIPAAISSLLWLPHLNHLRSSRGKIAIVTFDASKLTIQHLRAAWPGLDSNAIVIRGLEGTGTWEEARRKEATYDFDRIWNDLVALLDRLVEEHPDVELVLVECVTLCAFVPLIREHLGLPAFDIVALTRSWLQDR